MLKELLAYTALSCYVYSGRFYMLLFSGCCDADYSSGSIHAVLDTISNLYVTLRVCIAWSAHGKHYYTCTFEPQPLTFEHFSLNFINRSYFILNMCVHVINGSQME